MKKDFLKYSAHIRVSIQSQWRKSNYLDINAFTIIIMPSTYFYKDPDETFIDIWKEKSITMTRKSRWLKKREMNVFQLLTRNNSLSISLCNKARNVTPWWKSYTKQTHQYSETMAMSENTKQTQKKEEEEEKKYGPHSTAMHALTDYLFITKFPT